MDWLNKWYDVDHQEQFSWMRFHIDGEPMSLCREPIFTFLDVLRDELPKQLWIGNRRPKGVATKVVYVVWDFTKRMWRWCADGQQGNFLPSINRFLTSQYSKRERIRFILAFR